MPIINMASVTSGAVIYTSDIIYDTYQKLNGKMSMALEEKEGSIHLFFLYLGHKKKRFKSVSVLIFQDCTFYTL